MKELLLFERFQEPFKNISSEEKSNENIKQGTLEQHAVWLYEAGAI
jgi:hypothetical protein